MDKKKIELPKWAGRSIIDESHTEELDSRAAAHEMDKKLPRTQAEEEAYREYKNDHHARAAAHHLMGMKSAQGSGSMDEARKHGAMYGLHIRALGEDEYGPVPARVKQHVDAPDREQVYKFKAHKGDSLLLNDGEKDREPEREPKGSSWHAEPSEGKDAQHQISTLNPSQDTARDANRFDLGKSELDSRLHTLYKALRLAEALLAKGNVVQGNFPQHTANPSVQGPPAPVTTIDDARESQLVSPNQLAATQARLNAFLSEVGHKQSQPKAYVGGKWLPIMQHGTNPECPHDDLVPWNDHATGEKATFCHGCGAKFNDSV